MNRIFVSGIGTGIGKTIVSAILVQALEADYWKPIQAGNLEASDKMRVRELTSCSQSTLHPETYCLTQPMSPHAAAVIDNIHIHLDAISVPDTPRPLIIEGAGGLLVPLNRQTTVIDLIRKFDSEVVLVSRNYLGSINHTLLSLEALHLREIPIKGIIFNGPPAPATEEAIVDRFQIPVLLRIDQETIIDRSTVQRYADKLSKEKI